MKYFAVLFLALLALPQAVCAQTTVQTQAPHPAQRSFGQSMTAPASIGVVHNCPASQYYPDYERHAHIEGTTTLGFQIATDGSPKDFTIVKSSGDDGLDQAAIQCAANWRYRPAQQDGTPVEVPWRTMVMWSLSAGPTYVPPYPIGGPHTCLERAARAASAPVPGRVVLSYVVGIDGHVKDIQVMDSSGDADFDRYAQSCVAGWRFVTAMRDGDPVDDPHVSEFDW
jgi:TonB family protein